jgi:hypothetical protein
MRIVGSSRRVSAFAHDEAGEIAIDDRERCASVSVNGVPVQKATKWLPEISRCSLGLSNFTAIV